MCCCDFRAFFKNSSVGGGIYKKGPYYTKCGEMIDGCGNKKFGVVSHLIEFPQKIFVFFYPYDGSSCIFWNRFLDIQHYIML
jgi:hypothetical protein